MDEQHLEDWLRRRKERKDSRSAEILFPRIIDGDKEALSAGITVLESTLDRDRNVANELVNRALKVGNKSIRIGITGVPGVGKSTFIESFGCLLADKGLKVAVLAIDPSSAESGGTVSYTHLTLPTKRIV